MAIEYNENMKLIWYTQSKEVEIVEGDIPNRQWHFYFSNIDELIDLIKSNPELAKAIKEEL
ncbi:MAG: hypothetical protein ACFFCI_09355 [Promethearchaeota archaeon]